MAMLSTEQKANQHPELTDLVIGIIGGGFCGSMVLYHLLKNHNKLPKNTKIVVVDKRNLFNKGIAYSTLSDSHILNVPAANMGALPENPAGFLVWLNNNGHKTDPGDFVPRYLYADYLHSLISKELKAAKDSISIEFLHDEVVDISKIGEDKTDLFLKSGRQLKSTHLVIAAGNIPHFIPAGLISIQNSDKFISDPWRDSLLRKELLNSKEILIIGTSLTAIDTVLELEKSGFNGRYTMLSRHGYLPLSHHENHEVLPRIEIKNDTFKSVKSSLKWIKDNSKTHGWIPLFEAIRPQLQSFWLKWPEKEQNRFKRVMRPLWEIHRHRIPKESHKTIHELIKTGRINIISGNIVNSSEDSNYLTIEVRRRGENYNSFIKSDYVLNCTGLKDFSDSNQNSLRNSLLWSGTIHEDKTFGVQAKVDNNFNVISNSKPIKNVFILGALLKSQFGESTAVRELRVQAEKVATEIVRGLASGQL